MRRYAFAFVMATAVTLGQTAPLRELTTTTQGDTLFFSTKFKRPFVQGGPADEPHDKIVAWDAQGFRIVAQRPYDNLRETGADCSTPYRLQAPSVTGDGRQVAFLGLRTSDTRGCGLDFAVSTLRRADGTETDFPGFLRLSRNGAFGLRVFPDPRRDTPFFSAQTTEWIDFGANRRVPLDVFGPAASLSSNGRVVAEARDGFTLWENGVPRLIRVAGGCAAPAISDSGERVICSQWLVIDGSNSTYQALVSVQVATSATSLVSLIGRSPVASVDGAVVLFLAPSGSRTQAFLLRNGSLTQLTMAAQGSAPEGIREATLSGDGRVAFAVTPTNRLLRIDTQSVVTQELLPARSFLDPAASFPAGDFLDPDGRQGLRVAPGLRLALPGSGLASRWELGGQLLALLNTSREDTLEAVVPYGLNDGPTGLVAREAPAGLEQGPLPVTVLPQLPRLFPIARGRQENRYVLRSGLFQFADELTPAQQGEVVTAYYVGLGEVTPPVAAGTVTPVSPLSRLARPLEAIFEYACPERVRMPLAVEFAGLAPITVGLYQVNVRLPQVSAACRDARGLVFGRILLGEDPLPGAFAVIRP